MTDERLHKLRVRRTGWDYELSRRRFLSLVAASSAVGYAGCSQESAEKILPYVRQPADIVPGVPTDYATSFLIDGYATGLIARTRAGRPVKIEGNPAHPASLGATSAFHQAAVLQLYDPDRASAVAHLAQPSSWPAFYAALSRAAEARPSGAGLRILLEPTSSPLMHELTAELKRRYPEARVTFYASLHDDAAVRASEQLFGAALAPRYDLGPAQCVVALDSDLLATPYDLVHARRFAANRAPADATGAMTRLYAIEAAVSVTGGMADHRLRRPSGRVAWLTAALAGAVLPSGAPAASVLTAARGQLDPDERRFIDTLARDLRARPAGRTLVVAGERQPVEVHVLAQAMNVALGNLGSTVRFAPPAIPPGDGDQPLNALVAEMQAGKVETLLTIGGNPSYEAPADVAFSRALTRIPHSFYVGQYFNETAQVSRWFGPQLHPFETWGDGRAYDGTWSLVQPLIRPLVSAHSATEILGTLAGTPRGDRIRLRARFGAAHGEAIPLALSAAERVQRENPAVTRRWEELLAMGFAPGSAFPAVQVEARPSAIADATTRLLAAAPRGGLELNILPSPTVRDGRFANVSWLLELPAPITKLTWDNAALMSAATARALGLGAEAERSSDAHPIVELRRGERVLRIPALVAPGHADGSVSVWLGYGREGEERLARTAGVDVSPLRTDDARWFASDLRVAPLEQRYSLAITQRYFDQQDRTLALATTLAHYREAPGQLAEHASGPLPSLLPEGDGTGPQWAMTIDLSRCFGCGACMVACQAENNVLVVGRDQVRRGREMHWLRIDTYERPVGEEIEFVHQPMACQHCEKAPCEYVCPVNATVHSPDGLNEMVYNRCIGTRFCSNNCPYKVRRFNWFDWTEEEEANQGRTTLQHNPEVTVRERGVMEKCTYCVQRIRGAEIEARKERRPIGPGEVVTACQQACPSQAIVFGSLEHEQEPVVQWRRQPRAYEALHETNAQPRTQYLVRLRNPNPELAT